MPEFNFSKGEIILYDDCWMQFVEETADGIKVYNSLRYFFCEAEDIEKAQLPLALDGLGFQLSYNSKKGITRYKYRNFVILEEDGKFFINNIQVYDICEVQAAFNLYNLIPFHLLEKRMKVQIKRHSVVKRHFT